MNYPIRQLCSVLQLSRSSYYAYCSGITSSFSQERQKEAAQVRDVFCENRRRYGSRRISETLKLEGHPIGRHKVRSLMKEQGLTAIQPKSFVPRTTQSRHTLGYAPNLLAEVGLPTGPNQVYVGDITFLPTTYGEWLYLNVWMDLYSRYIVGWKLDNHMEESLVKESLQMAIYKRSPPSGLIVHSDRGGQYAGHSFRGLLTQYQVRQSMSGADNPYDNAFAESFFSRFKAELLQKGAFQSKQDAITEVFDFIERYYNTKRLHSSLGYSTPLKFEKQNQ
jgi:transposase InsO family protein